MKILIDTSVWSLALRRRGRVESQYVIELEKLVKEFRVQMMGHIRQELLSGIRSHSQFRSLKSHLAAFPDLELQTSDYEQAAEFFNVSRHKGIQGSNTDFLICAVSYRNGMPILTTDSDFVLLQKHIPIKLYNLNNSG